MLGQPGRHQCGATCGPVDWRGKHWRHSVCAGQRLPAKRWRHQSDSRHSIWRPWPGTTKSNDLALGWARCIHRENALRLFWQQHHDRSKRCWGCRCRCVFVCSLTHLEHGANSLLGSKRGHGIANTSNQLAPGSGGCFGGPGASFWPLCMEQVQFKWTHI